MDKKLFIFNFTSANLIMYYCGYEKCKPGHACGPVMRDHCLFVYIKSGTGVYTVNNITYKLTKNDSFFLFPGHPIYYRADNSDPWEYMWIGFHGDQAIKYLNMAGITPETPILHHTNHRRLEYLFKKLFSIAGSKSTADQICCTGLLHLIFSEIINESLTCSSNFSPNSSSFKDNYIEKAISFIHFNYSVDISISEIAESVGLERGYFSKLFKDNIKMSPYEFLLKYRIEKATRLLAHTSMPIEHVAYSVGFKNPLYFSKAFKKRTGIAPSIYRKNFR